MNQRFSYTLLVFFVVCGMQLIAASASAQILPRLGNDRAATSGFQFTKVVVDARSAAMGSSSAADAKDASSLYWNPALASRLNQHELMFGHTGYFAGISMEYVSLIYKVKDFSFGGSLQFLDSGEIKETDEFNPFGTGRTFRTNHYSIGLTASHSITDLFSYGLTLRYLSEQIERVDVNTPAIDFGFFYAVGETGLRFSVGVNNFWFDATPSGFTTRQTIESGNNEQREEEFDDVRIPTRFILATAYDAIKTDVHGLILTGQITNPSDNAEQFSVGAEYGYVNQFFLRAGYQFGIDEVEYPSFGAGVKVPFRGRSFTFDYAFNAFERLGNVNRLSVRLSL